MQYNIIQLLNQLDFNLYLNFSYFKSEIGVVVNQKNKMNYTETPHGILKRMGMDRIWEFSIGHIIQFCNY